MNGADVLVRALREQKVEYLFGVPGAETLELLDAVTGAESILVVPTRHEQHAAFMAATYGRLTGEPGVCFSSSGAGATNLMTGLAQAQLAGMPLVAITAEKSAARRSPDCRRGLDIPRALESVTKWNSAARDPREIRGLVRRAFREARAERPGSAYIELPADVARARAHEKPAALRMPVRRALPDPAAIQHAAIMIQNCRQPIAVAGGGANRAPVVQELARFAEDAGIYVLTTPLGKGALSDDHPYSLFSLGVHEALWETEAIDRADLIVAIGYFPAEYPPAVLNHSATRQLVHIDFNEAPVSASYDPDAEVVGDIAASLRALREAMREDSPRHPSLDAVRDRIDWKLHRAPIETSFPPGPQKLVRSIREIVPRDGIVSLGSGIHTVWFARNYPVFLPNTLLMDSALAPRGAGLAAAMAAKLVHPDRQVVAVCPDGGFMMNGQDLETAVRLGLDLVIVVIREPALGFDLGRPDFVAYAESHGAPAFRLESGSDLRSLLAAALRTTGPAVIDCPIDWEESRTAPKFFPAQLG